MSFRTITHTATVTDTIMEKLLPKARRNNQGPITISPSNVPTYASACSGTARYSSACSCWGITACTTTEPTPTATVSTTVTVTVSVCPWGATQCWDSCHDLQQSHDNCGKCGRKVSLLPKVLHSYPSLILAFYFHISTINILFKENRDLKWNAELTSTESAKEMKSAKMGGVSRRKTTTRNSATIPRSVVVITDVEKTTNASATLILMVKASATPTLPATNSRLARAMKTATGTLYASRIAAPRKYAERFKKNARTSSTRDSWDDSSESEMASGRMVPHLEYHERNIAEALQQP